MPRLVSLRGSIIITSDLTEEMVTKYWFHNFQKKCGKINIWYHIPQVIHFKLECAVFIQVVPFNAFVILVPDGVA